MLVSRLNGGGIFSFIVTTAAAAWFSILPVTVAVEIGGGMFRSCSTGFWASGFCGIVSGPGGLTGSCAAIGAAMAGCGPAFSGIGPAPG